MPVNPEHYLARPGPFWYEDRINDRNVSCVACGSRARLLWIFRAAGDARVGMLAMCPHCVYTPCGYIAVQGILRP
jgi:hypothetical protein